ncbi:alpha/beta hydrolase [Asticcacaulis sp. 201]|uniref:alpha/beta hydrolase n=1 Tax=Asticcacaulis sp. 201 TaxID=3028787 RepID=UPI002916D848|nr:alpha/beta hydrolase-fold protein [Asticcacaulis sp. 201]MDV6330997.1 alpha/beta hydrolase-fold protein [Asticcacaulis sp. 201]
MKPVNIVAVVVCLALLASPLHAAPSVGVERITVHSVSLEGNLEGESPDRTVIVYLPPDYATNPKKRYPVVYALHGYSINNDIWSKEIKAQETIAGAYASGTQGMIIVLPNSQTLHNGSMYSSSVTIGDWEGFITHDLVSYIDSHYRTIADRASRGLAGHSMGGYGTLRLGMKYPDVFGALYAMSPCCLSARSAPSPEDAAQLEALKSPEESQKLGFFTRGTLAVSAAWAPNPKNPPFYLDLPTKGGVPQPSVLNRWAANAPLSMVDQYIFNLRRYTAIAIDVGDRDGLKVDAEQMHTLMQNSGVANSFEIYSGDHVSGVADRFQNHVLPFFSKTLSFTQPARK